MKTILVLFIAFLGHQAMAFENDLRAICHRPGTNELYVGGEFNSVFVVDSKSGETIRQFSIEGGLTDMQFDPEGNQLIVASNNKLYFVDPESGEKKRTVNGAKFVLFENSPYFLDVAWYGNKSVRVFSTKDAAVVFEHKNESAPFYASMSADFSELFIIYKEEEIKKEKNLVLAPTEEGDGYNVYNKAYVKQEKDGKGSRFVSVDMNSKSVQIDVTIPYSSSGSYGTSFSKFGENYYLASWDVFLRIDSKGGAYPISYSGATFAYATNHSSDGKFIMVLSTKEGFSYNCENGTFHPVSVKENSEFAYSTDIIDVNGNFITLAKDYSVNEVTYDGSLENRFKITRSSNGKGFGVYYYNGYSKKEDRDKEAAIINAQLQELEMDVIDLETDPGKSDFLIGIFPTETEATEFTETLDSEGLSYLTKVAPIE